MPRKTLMSDLSMWYLPEMGLMPGSTVSQGPKLPSAWTIPLGLGFITSAT